MNRKILEVTFNGFDTDAKGIGNRLTGYVPIILYHFHYAGVNIFSLQFGFIGIYVQISAMELMLCSNHKV